MPSRFQVNQYGYKTNVVIPQIIGSRYQFIKRTVIEYQVLLEVIFDLGNKIIQDF